MIHHLRTLALVLTALTHFGRPALAAVPPYTLVGQFNLPVGTSAFDITPDGRILALAQSQLFLQSAPNSSSWSLAGSLPSSAISSFGASFLRISPDFSTIAIGDGAFGPSSQVHFLSAASLNPSSTSPLTSITTPNFQAHWRDDSRLLVTGSGSKGAVVTEVSLSGPALSQRTLISDILGASAGVTADYNFLYTANGFSFGAGSPTGEVRAFSLADLDSASAPLSFESQGIPVARALTGSSLGFDPLGNLLIGGGDAFTPGADNGFAALINASDLASALLAGPIASPALSLFPPAPPSQPANSYSPQFNPATRELLLSFFDNTSFTPGLTVYRYALPAPGAASLLLLAGLFAARRIRHA